MLLFAYVFGSAIVLPGGGNYHAYLIGGMLGMGVAGTAPGTAVALVTDMSTGLIDRFRALPMSRAAVLAGRTLADLLTQGIGALVVAGVGLAIGWRVHTGPADVLAAFGLALLFGYAFTWAGACLGMLLRSPESAQQLGFILFLPLTFISNAFVPTQGMPGWLQAVANWNPFSALAAATGTCSGTRTRRPRCTCGRCSTRNRPCCWSAALLLVFAPLPILYFCRALKLAKSDSAGGGGWGPLIA